MLRYFGVHGVEARLREHIRLARLFADEVARVPDLELLAPVQFSVVVFRHRPAGLHADELDAYNQALLDRLNASGEVFLSHTIVRGRFGLRLAVGNLRTTERHVRRVLELIREYVGEGDDAAER